jgi:dipeptidyl aminopeptidase/acylaminoacyl peptidase
MSTGVNPRCILLCALWLAQLAVTPASSQTNLTYQKPPQAMCDLVDALPPPGVLVSPGNHWMLIEQRAGLPTIADLAQPELRLAGLRFNPKTNGRSRVWYFTSLKVQALPDGREVPITGLPEHSKIIDPAWSPDARKISFVEISDATGSAGLTLWIADVATAKARQLPGVRLNGMFGAPCEWFSNSEDLVCRTVLRDRGAPPLRSEVPAGPIIQENAGRTTPARTYEDLLKNADDERVFDYYAVSQIRVVSLNGADRPLGEPGVIQQATPSPDGKYVLVSQRHHPYSYLHPIDNFPLRVEVLGLHTGNAKLLVDKPLADDVPVDIDAVPVGPRQYEWRSDAPASLLWIEAGDGGDPKKDVPVRDTLYSLQTPFTGVGQKIADLPLRFAGITWGSEHLALVEEGRWKDRKRMILALDPAGAGPPATLFDGSFEDRYHDPGAPMTELNRDGKAVLVTAADSSGIYFAGAGASAEGDRPFVDVMNSRTGESRRLWRSEAPFFEQPLQILDASKPTLLYFRESQEQNANLWIRDLSAQPSKQVTFIPNPYGSTPLPKKQLLKYKRADGVDLTANLYLPPGYKPHDGPLPTLMEAYPVEYKTRSAAGQVIGSSYYFPYFWWGSPVFFVTQGYAVLESASIPIVGEGKEEPNDTYVEQLVAGAQAAIDEGKRLGVVDPARVAVMGHSYGAFMTANLLAHSNLFKAGIARSGAYNRTLTPFGFQSEERSYWQAPEIYYKMSPFSFADKVKTPLLLIHGEADDNAGTFPIQSERFYSALKGHGARVRFVLLPLEAHGYAARESVLHMLWEMNNWLDTYVKKAANQSAHTANMKP